MSYAEAAPNDCVDMPNDTLIETIDELFPQHELWVHCKACRHATKLDRTKLRELHGNLHLKTLSQRGQCPDCDKIGIKVLIVWDC